MMVVKAASVIGDRRLLLIPSSYPALCLFGRGRPAPSPLADHHDFDLKALIKRVQAYGRELAEAGEWCRKYRVSRKDSDLHQVPLQPFHRQKQAAALAFQSLLGPLSWTIRACEAEQELPG